MVAFEWTCRGRELAIGVGFAFLEACACSAHDKEGADSGAIDTGSSLGGAESSGDGDAEEGPGPRASQDEMPFVAPTTFSCDPELSGKSPPLRRLSAFQYRQTLRDLLGALLNDESEIDSVWDEIQPAVLGLLEEQRFKLPEDLHGSYRRLDQAVQQSHVDSWYEIGRAAAAALSTPERLSQLLGDCQTDAVGETEVNDCLDVFVARFGGLAFRRPLESSEVEFYRNFHGASDAVDPAGIADVVTGLLNAPQFLYLIEQGGDAVDQTEGTFELAPYELASRLSYHFWNTMPDQELLDLADSGELLEDEVYEGQVERLFVDMRTRQTIDDFFREWLKLEDLPQLDRNNEAGIFQTFAGEHLPSPDLRQSMIDETIALLNYYTWDHPEGLEAALLTPYSFARGDELAAIYGVSPWDGSDPPPDMESERIGLLSRAAFLATGTPNTRPIMKGLFIRTNILCDVVPPPPPGANAELPELNSDLTTREVVEALTEADGTSCANCHARIINPLGFATEGFDGLGRIRTEQMLFDEDGALAGYKSIDTSSVPQVTKGDETRVSGAVQLMETIASSGKAEACLARHYFRFTFGRWEGVISDGCVLEQLRAALAEGGSVADMLRSVALSDAFRRRSFSPSTGEAN